MKRLFLTIALTAVDWFPSEPPEPAVFPIVAPDEEFQKREVIYVKACERAKQNGACTYQSDGKPGSYLPEGRYLLVWHKGEVYYQENPKIIPREDCPT